MKVTHVSLPCALAADGLNVHQKRSLYPSLPPLRDIQGSLYHHQLCARMGSGGVGRQVAFIVVCAIVEIRDRLTFIVAFITVVLL